MSEAKNWTTVTESQFPWEREAIEFVRSQFPVHEPYRAWANFTFIGLDGSLNEVDLLIFTPVGFFLVEIKSRPGRIFGDAATWKWEHEGKIVTRDNPVVAADLKAKKLKSLLQQQRAAKKKVAVPYLDTLVFCSDPNQVSDLTGNAAAHLCLRDRKVSEGASSDRPGIMAAIKFRECPGLRSRVFGEFNKPTSKMIAQALTQAGIRKTQRHLKVGDYNLDKVIGEGPGYQDWSASHVLLQNSSRRIRIYNVRSNASADERETLERAARREAELLEGLQHPGILKREGYTPHELGPALIFEYDPQALRLDHYVSQKGDSLSASERCRLLREIAEVVRFAHERQTYHRGLAPQSILVNDANPLARIKILNWQSGFRGGLDESQNSRLVSATSHLERLVDDATSAYVAPEALSNQELLGEKQDLFSLGAIGYFLFSGESPATNGLELSEKLRDSSGLQISAVLSGARENLQDLIQLTTSPIVADRIDSASEFLDLLTLVEDDLKTSENNYVENPQDAGPTDFFPGDYMVHRRIGSGASSIAFLVEREELLILKVASDPGFNDRLKEEAEVLKNFHHARIAEYVDSIQVGKHAALLIRPAISDRKKLKIETLRQRLKEYGPLHLDLLQRFGVDLLSALIELEENNTFHRDIKPDNIAVGQVRSGDHLHMVLFDFSLSKVSLENISAGTPGYLDPMLPLRKERRFDSYAERYAVAVTLYQMATGHKNYPNWSPDGTDPTHLDTDGEFDPELFDVSIRDDLTEFFTRAFSRDLKRRHDNAEQMRNAWLHCFAGLEDAGSHSNDLDEDEFRRCLDAATLDTLVSELGLGKRATLALDKINIHDVRQLLATSIATIHRTPGVGKSTVNLIKRAIRQLQQRLGASLKVPIQTDDDAASSAETDDRPSIDQLVHRISRVGATQADEVRSAMAKYLVLDEEAASHAPTSTWPSQQQLSELTDASHVQVRKWIDGFRKRWDKESALTRVRSEIFELLRSLSGVATISEIASALLASRGSHQIEPHRTRGAVAVVCAAVEVESHKAEPRFALRRGEVCSLLSIDPRLSSLAIELGAAADALADEDPLVSPPRAIQQLQAIASQYDSLVSDSRLLRLAASASRHAALSSRNEFYPQAMDAARAIKLSQSALYGTGQLTPRQIRERVQSRYPQCGDIPNRPELDRLLTEAGFDYRWDDQKKTFVTNIRDSLHVTSGTETLSRYTTTDRSELIGDDSPEVAAARQFEQKIQHTLKNGGFLALVVEPRRYHDAITALSDSRFDTEVVDFEGLFLDLMREVALKARVDWNLVLDTDRVPGQGDWNKLLLLIGRVMPQIIESILSHHDKTVLLVYPSLLARYDQLSVIDQLQQAIGRQIKGLWLLVPGSGTAMIDGQAVPLISPSHSTAVPKSWLQNRHRGMKRVD